jgi:hypothetical protein
MLPVRIYVFLRKSEFGPQYQYIIWSLNSESHDTPFNRKYGNCDVVANDNLLAGLPG